jgi:tungstate transport system substrate-binding protein
MIEGGLMRRILLFCLLLAATSLVSSSPVVHGAESGSRNVILSTTTSTQDSGLLDVLVPLFEKQSGYTVKTVSVGTGQALALAAKGDADVALVHAPSLEKQFVTDGKLLNRRLVMYNDFVIIGPKDDPAKIRLTKNAIGALKAIELAKASFVSRGDNSGTHTLESLCGNQPVSNPKAPGTSKPGRAWARPSGLPTSAMPIRSRTGELILPWASV